MADTSQTLEERVRTALQTLIAMEAHLRAVQQYVQGLGFMARSFVERDITSSTGRGFGEWIAATARLKTSLTSLSSGTHTGAVATARQTLTDELPRLAALRGYLERVPQKIGMVPGAMLKPQQRGEVLAQLDQQAKALQALEEQLTSVFQAFQAAG